LCLPHVRAAPPRPSRVRSEKQCATSSLHRSSNERKPPVLLCETHYVSSKPTGGHLPRYTFWQQQLPLTTKRCTEEGVHQWASRRHSTFRTTGTPVRSSNSKTVRRSPKVVALRSISRWRSLCFPSESACTIFNSWICLVDVAFNAFNSNI
jgi:hypothetical protein